jgi:aryl-alcohol dehydrogenase-like predicted oxidoreductase
LLDCANVYSEGKSEQVIGNALKRNGKRHDVLVTSKAYLPTSDRPNASGNSRHNLINSCLNSLKQLQTDYIDIFFFIERIGMYHRRRRSVHWITW